MRKYFAEESDRITELEKENQKRVRAVGGECMVLLKNEDVLPLAPGKIALYGYGVRHTIKGGTGSGDVNVRGTINVEQGMEQEGFQVTNKEWLDRYDEIVEKAEKDYLVQTQKLASEKNIPIQMVMFENPYQLPEVPEITEKDVKASKTDTAIFVLSRISGEGCDRRYRKGDYLLSDREEQALRFLSDHYKNTILLLNTGGVMELGTVRSMPGVKGIMIIGQNGSEGGILTAQTLSGKTVPSGKLCDTWAASYEDYPYAMEYGSNNGNVDDEYYKEDIFVGYRYFNTNGIKPEFCFGYGLGYTNFDVKTEKFAAVDEKVTLSVNVKNTGTKWPGKEVMQVYVSKPEGKLKQPYQELAQFAKTSQLMPGQEEKLELSFALSSLASYDEEAEAYILEKGEYIIRVGNSSENTCEAGKMTLEKDILVKKVKNCLFEGNPEVREERTLYENTRKEKLTLADVKEGKASLEELTAQLTVEEMAKLCVGVYDLEAGDVVGAASNLVPGAAGETNSSLEDDRKIPALILADGPAGLRLQPHFKTDKEGTLLPGGNQRGMEVIPFPENLPEDTIDYYQYCTAFPIAATLAQSWNRQLLRDMGKIVASEMEKFHIDLWLAPGMNIHRNPLCGRNYEYYSEDPILTGEMAAAQTEGMQNSGKHGVTIKHLAVNNQEDNRMFNNAHVSERALREIYLRGFEIAVKKAKPYAIMTSYNLINGTHAANHYGMLQKVCRDEWGFDGLIMTDWCTSQDTSYLGFSSDKYPWSSSTGCIKAGNDLQMPGCEENVRDIIEGVESGEISIGDLQFCTANILKTVLRLKF